MAWFKISYPFKKLVLIIALDIGNLYETRNVYLITKFSLASKQTEIRITMRTIRVFAYLDRINEISTNT